MSTGALENTSAGALLKSTGTLKNTSAGALLKSTGTLGNTSTGALQGEWDALEERKCLNSAV